MIKTSEEGIYCGMAELKGDFQEDIEDGRSERENKGNFQCKKCGQQFTLSGNYRRHVLHNKVCGSRKQGFKCSNCHKQFSLNATLKDHYERCIAEDPYRFSCPYCPKLFTFKSSLNKHVRGRCRYAKKNENLKIYKCKYCDADFFQYAAWRKHLSEGICMTENDQQQQHVCPHCANRFTLKSSLNKHLKGRCKAMKEETQGEEGHQKYDIIVNIREENGEEIITPYEVTTKIDDDINDYYVIEECPQWETFETENVKSYIEIANADDDEDEVEDDYEFVKEVPQEKL